MTSATMISGRMFLVGAAAATAAPLLPATTISSSAQALAAPVKPATTIWVGGTEGEFDWVVFDAPTREEALEQLWCEHGYTADDAPSYLRVDRVASMDGLRPREVTGADWVRAGLNHTCERCGDEPYEARLICEEVVCEGCMTIADRMIDSPEDAEDDLVEIIAEHDFNLAAAAAETTGAALVPAVVWLRALSRAREAYIED